MLKINVEALYQIIGEQRITILLLEKQVAELKAAFVKENAEEILAEEGE